MMSSFNRLSQASEPAIPLRRPKIRRAWSAPSHRQPPPNQPLKVSGFHLHRDIESEFQSELGKNLFEQTVQLQENSATLAPVNISNLPATGRIACCWRQCDKTPHLYDQRRCVNIRDTICKSPLVTENKNFISYFTRGQLDKVSVAKSRGYTDLPVPNIGKFVKRVRSADVGSLTQFSLKDQYCNESIEEIRGNYWRSKVLEKEEKDRITLVEGICRDILNELCDGPVSDQLYFSEKRKHLLKIKMSLDEETENWINLVKEEAKREAEQREAAAKKLLEYEESKRPKRKKNSKKKRPKSILKSRLRSKSDTDSDLASLKSSREGGKSVRFRENLTDTKIINRSKTGTSKKRGKKKQETGLTELDQSKGQKKAGGRILSPKRRSSRKKKTFPGYTSSEKLSKQKVTPIEEISSVSPIDSTTMGTKADHRREEISNVGAQDETVDCLPQELVKIVIPDEPPNFSLADEYHTKKELVADWLQNKYCSAAPKTIPLI